nr:uncharacterized protein LOC117228922 [Megalopta genalis]
MLCIRYPYNSYKGRLSDVLESLNTILEYRSDKKIIFIIPENKIKEFNEIKRVFNNKCYEEATDRKFTLNDLTEESQQKLLKQEVILQGEKISLNKLIDKSDKNSEQIIDAKTLEGLITNNVIKIGSRPLGTVGLEGAYSNLDEEVNMETFIDKLLSEESSDIYIISGIPSIFRENNLFEYLVNAFMDISKTSKVNDFESRITVLNQNDRIQIANDQFKIVDFKHICQNNWERKIYWINLKHEGNVTKFMLKQIYDPDFCLKGNKFHNEVVIEKNIRELLAISIPSEIFIIGGKSKEEVRRWLEINSGKERLHFTRNCNNNWIKFLNSQDDMSATFQELVAQNRGQTIHLLKFEQDQLIWYKTQGSLMNLSKYRGKNHRNTEHSIEADALITEIKDDKVVIIAGNPGMGKSTALVKLYELQYALQSGTKESIIKSHWLITVNLKSHLAAINNIDFYAKDIVKEITNFLLQVNKSISDGFTRSLLGMALVKQDFAKPLLIVLDGFDELVIKNDRDKVMSLLKHLKNETKAKVWITTSLLYEQALASTVSTFAIRLAPIGDEILSKLIKKYLKNNLSLILSHKEFQSIFGNSDEIIENTRMQEYTKALLNKMHEVFTEDMSKLIGTPLQLYLTLEGSSKYFKAWTRNVNSQSPDFSYLGNNMFEVYEKFLDRKYIYLKKVREQVEQEKDKVTFDNYYKTQTKSSIITLAREQSLEKFRSIEYLHPTYVDYFAAVLCLRSKGNLQKCLLKEVSGNSEYQVLHTFLNSRLLKEKMVNIDLQEEYYRNVLFEAANDCNLRIVRFVLDNLDNSSSILAAKNNSGRTVLHVAVISGNLDIVKFLVDEKKADFNVKDNNGMTVLYTAAAFGKSEIVKYLIGKGADVDAKNNMNRTVLHMAATMCNLEIVKLLISKGVNVDAKDDCGMTVLYMAATSGNLDVIKFLVNEKGANIDANANHGMEMLHVATTSGNLDMIKFLMDEKGVNIMAKCNSLLYFSAVSDNLDIVKYLVNEKEANVDNKNECGIPTLHGAAVFGNLDIMKFLINEKKADFNAKEICGRSILHTAAVSGDLDKIKFLVNEKKLDVNAKNDNDVTILHVAVQANNLNVVKYLIDEGANVHAKDRHDVTVLHMAAKSGNLEIVKYLIDKGANVDAKNIFGLTILHNAAQSGNVELVNFLINEQEFDFTTKENKRSTVLHSAISSGNLDMIKFLVIEKKANVYTVDNRGMTVLEATVLSGNLDMVKFLINRRKVYYRTKDNNGRTVLHVAAIFGKLEIVKFLINEKNLNFNEKDKIGSTVWHLAALSCNVEIVKFLLEKGANVNAKDNFGATALHIVASSGDLKMVKFLVKEKNINLNAKDNNDMTILHVAFRSDNFDVIEFLINETKVDFNAVDNTGMPILHLAALSHNIKMINFLLNKGANVDVKSNIGITVLHIIASSGNFKLVQYLVNEKMADFNAKDNTNRTILHVAARFGNFDVVKFLINEKGADFNVIDNYGATILHAAATTCNIEMIKFLIDKGVNVNAKDVHGITFLQVVASYGHLEVLKFLVNEKELDSNTKDYADVTILHAAATSGNLDMVKFLINEKKADFNAIDLFGRTVLHMAAKSGNTDLVTFLVNEKKADFNAKDNSGGTILHRAVESRNLNMVKFLINEKKANFDPNGNDFVRFFNFPNPHEYGHIIDFLKGIEAIESPP